MVLLIPVPGVIFKTLGDSSLLFLEPSVCCGDMCSAALLEEDWIMIDLMGKFEGSTFRLPHGSVRVVLSNSPQSFCGGT